MRTFLCRLSLLCVVSALVWAQQSGSVNLQEKMTFSDSVDATVTVVSGDIQAGDPFAFTLKLDKAPNFKTGAVQYTVTGPANETFGTSCYQTQEDTAGHYHCEFPTAVTAAGGIWKIKEIHFAEGVVNIPLNFKPITFRVIPNSGLILPTSAEVTVNLSQKQLLRREARRLEQRIQQLKSEVSNYVPSGGQKGLSSLLQRGLVDSINALKETQAEFGKLTTDKEQIPNAQIFFDDLYRTYDAAISHLGRFTAATAGGGHLMRISGTEKVGAEPLLSLALRPMEQNELAYNVVADQSSLIFDLEVDSTPAGATVSYSRKGDNHPTQSGSPTRSTIHSLTLAIWTVHFEKPGYKPEEREHDPFRESNHFVHVDLQSDH
ncbi:MAG: hypothetical protein WAQ52_02095 [Terriglobales bacterium]